MAEGHFIRVIKRKEVLTLAFGAMIGWSWVALTGGWINEAGSLGAITAFAIGGFTVILVGFTYAELAAANTFILTARSAETLHSCVRGRFCSRTFR